MQVVSALQEAEQADLEAMAGEPEGVHLLSARQKEGIREFARQRSMQINPHPHHHSRHPNTPAGSMSRAVSFGTNLQVRTNWTRPPSPGPACASRLNRMSGTSLYEPWTPIKLIVNIGTSVDYARTVCAEHSSEMVPERRRRHHWL